MKQNLIDLNAYDFCLDKNLFNILSLFLIGIFFLISSRRLHILIRINGSLETKIHSTPLNGHFIITDSFRCPLGSLGKEIPYIFSDSTRLIRDTPLVQALFLAPSAVSVLAGLIVVRKHNFGWVRLT